ncbi:glycosyltransferase family 2 protein [Priestia megaterium]|uniref:glycosyltransferase family 2 protein n=1 Tax=Priestia megaterium TaxID=1404 RepID=UPI002079CC44|nr:glycosyltransferase family A protein [Priestia megaterium]USL27636.1 glycosyltransferase family 2 protein [Priestia megaterium]USL33579.1 glycosyltransferase family 2 protein [Priestia megaterium]WDM31648.1 glycosyltransferase family 2 protein [Priestia megaterium]
MRDVGIVMPVYKQDPIYLELALRSILEQSYNNYYFVIVSDGAPPDTVSVIKDVTKEDERIHLILKEENEGVAKTLNVGFDYLMKIEEVKYFTWVSSDNVYYPTFIEKLRDALELASEDVGLSFSNFIHVDHNLVPLDEPQYKDFYKYQNQPKENLLDVCFIGVSFMYKKQVAAMIDGYRLEPVEDYDYWLRLTEQCEIIFVPYVLMEYRTNSPQSVSAQLRNSKSQHRRWRYAFKLAQHEARNRRGIPFKLTVIYPVQDGSKKTIEKLELLLEQYFSNYKLIIIDRSLDRSAINVLQHIEDPRVKFLELPGASEKEAITLGLTEADTPFTLIYGKGVFPSTSFVLQSLMLYHNQYIEQGLEKTIISTTDISEGNISARTVPLEEEPAFGHLYQTERLIEILKYRK